MSIKFILMVLGVILVMYLIAFGGTIAIIKILSLIFKFESIKFKYMLLIALLPFGGLCYLLWKFVLSTIHVN